eukprot:4758941-Amphidinium_carterae.1
MSLVFSDAEQCVHVDAHAKVVPRCTERLPLLAGDSTKNAPGETEACTVTLEGVELAQSALEDFVESYFMFHDLRTESVSDLLRHVPPLLFVEGHIYDLDQANEDHLGRSKNPSFMKKGILYS